MTNSITALKEGCNAECQVCWVSQITPWGWVSLLFVLLCWMLVYRASSSGVATFSITTLSIMTLIIMTLSIKGLFVTLSIKGLFMTLGIKGLFVTLIINDIQTLSMTKVPSCWVSLCWVSWFSSCYAECRGALRAASNTLAYSSKMRNFAFFFLKQGTGRETHFWSEIWIFIFIVIHFPTIKSLLMKIIFSHVSQEPKL